MTPLPNKTFAGLFAVAVAALVAMPSVSLAGSEAAKPEGADFTKEKSTLNLPGTDTVVQRLVMNLPAGGVVIFNATGWAVFDGNPAGIICGISRDSTTNGPTFVAQHNNELNANRMTLAVTRGLKEKKGGKKVYKLVCKTQQGSMSIYNMTLTGIYTPNRY